MRIFKSYPLLRMVNSYVIDSPQPSNISYWWNFGSLLALCLIIQILSGVFLAMISIASVTEVFNLFENPENIIVASNWINVDIKVSKEDIKTKK